MQTNIPQLSPPELRRFGLMTGGVFMFIFGLALPWWWGVHYPQWPWWIGAAFALPAVLYPTALSSVYQVWMRIGLAIGWVMSRVILTLTFYLVLLPLGLLMRLQGHDPMQRGFEQSLQTYRKMSIALPKQRMEKPF